MPGPAAQPPDLTAPAGAGSIGAVPFGAAPLAGSVGPLGAARSALTAAAAVCGVLAALVALAALPGCAAISMPDAETFAELNPLYVDKEAEAKEVEEWGKAAETSVSLDVKYVGEYTSVTGRNAVVVTGVGLVHGLRGTGGNPVPGEFRTRLLDDMKTRGVTGGKDLLARTDTALVVVTAYIPPLVDKKEPLDVEVRIPPGSNATDLSGGWLLECDLMEGANLGGTFRAGKTLATATGPVLVRASDDPAARRASLSRGKVLGGGVTRVDRRLEMRMHHRYKSTRMVEKVVRAVGKRFHHRGPGGVEESVAKAHTDVKITLDVPDIYKEDFPRFLRVVDNVVMKESPVARRLRLEQLEDDLLHGPTAEVASIRLEAVGDEAAPILKRGVESDDEEVRFHAAVALAYLGRSDGLETLRIAARDEPAFRVYALAALAAAGGPQAATQLRSLLADPLPETRYGAFRALWTVAPDDAYLNHRPMREIDPDTDRPTGPTLFHLHPVRVDGGGLDLEELAAAGNDESTGSPAAETADLAEPLVHINHNRRAEVVLFGPEQRFKTPLTLRGRPPAAGLPAAGRHGDDLDDRPRPRGRAGIEHEDHRGDRQVRRTGRLLPGYCRDAPGGRRPAQPARPVGDRRPAHRRAGLPPQGQGRQRPGRRRRPHAEPLPFHRRPGGPGRRRSLRTGGGREAHARTRRTRRERVWGSRSGVRGSGVGRRNSRDRVAGRVEKSRRESGRSSRPCSEATPRGRAGRRTPPTGGATSSEPP